MAADIQAIKRPNALASAREARIGWRKAVSQTINGWGIVTAESHRVAALKGNDLVFFAPAGADFDNPNPISEQEKSQALDAAIKWARAQTGPLN